MCTKNKPLISIVIPTKDRYLYLKQVVNLIMGYEIPELELVIQDNSTNNSEFVEFLQQYNSNRIVYNYTKDWIAIRDNLDNGIQNSHGEYVCVIGDDDGVMENIVDCAKWMKSNNVDVLIPLVVQYNWPDYITDRKNKSSGIIFYPKGSTFENIPTEISTNKVLKKKKKNGFINRGQLPLCYHGIASRKILEKIYQRGGHYSPGPSPDIACGVALSLTAERYFRTNYPVIISGASAMHGGGIRKLKGRIADIDDVVFLPKGAKKDWERSLPLFWCAETVWPESAIKALRYMGREDLVNKVNYNKIYYNFACGHPGYFKYAVRKASNKISFVIYFCLNYSYKIFSAVMRRVRAYVTKTNLMYDKIEGVNNISEAASYLNERYKGFDVN